MKNKLLQERLMIQKVVATGIGAALFVVISMISIPTPAPNTYIQLQYAVQVFFATIFGPSVGFLLGVIGHTIRDSMYDAPWWSWILASGVVGFIMGLAKNKFRVSEGIFEKKDAYLFNVYQLVANSLAWGGIAPVLDILIYSQPANKVFAQGLIAGVANILTVAIAGTLLLSVYAKSRTQSGSLSKD